MLGAAAGASRLSLWVPVAQWIRVGLARLEATSGAGTVDDQSQLYIKGLLSDAKILAKYGQRTDAFDSGNLVAAINTIENTDPAKITPAQISALQKEIVAASNTIPSSIVSELQGSGLPYAEKKPTRTIAIMIAASIALMILAANLTQLYNRGSALASDLRALQASEPERHFGQLARQLFVAMREIADSPPGEDDKKTDVLEQQAYYQIYDDLRELDRKLQFMQNGIQQYQIDTVYPVWGMETLKYYYYYSLKYLGLGDAEVYSFLSARDLELKSYEEFGVGGNKRPNPAETVKPTALGASSLGSGAAAHAAVASSGSVPTPVPSDNENEASPPAQPAPTEPAGKYLEGGTEYAGSYFCNQKSQSAGDIDGQITLLDSKLKLPRFADLTKDYYYSLQYLSCYEHFAFLPYNTPSLDEMKARLERIMTPYAFWVLPAIYGALGALIFHLRMLWNPLLPNPSALRIIHRVALGSLAGMILAWFWLPDTTIGSELAKVGFGLFSLAFVFGFSLDVFFAMLDRFVSLSVTAMGKVGAEQAKA